ncbi:hypothetical protein MKW98_003945 [Papaver atlanticum]|uniref:Uncharacterized protein n=1 Tax=Papaver atlanticum TaxID=357466 RepID=A0AAD4SMY8_9MAGN|nr:hypothetical protein MKW98_003945 [Papaver atlanticum]
MYFNNRLANKPDALTEGEWKDLVKFWETDETHQKFYEQNVKSRTCQQAKHTMGRKCYARCKAEMAEDNGGNPPTDGDVFIKTHVNKKNGKALDPISQGFIVQMREQSGLDENGFDENGNQQPISDEVFGNVVPTTRQKRVRTERYPTCSIYERNEDFERRMNGRKILIGESGNEMQN